MRTKLLFPFITIHKFKRKKKTIDAVLIIKKIKASKRFKKFRSNRKPFLKKNLKTRSNQIFAIRLTEIVKAIIKRS